MLDVPVDITPPAALHACFVEVYVVTRSRSLDRTSSSVQSPFVNSASNRSICGARSVLDSHVSGSNQSRNSLSEISPARYRTSSRRIGSSSSKCMSPRIQVVAVSATELRRMFNDGLYVERVQSGELTEKVLSQNTPSPRAHQQPGTKSQLVAYLDAQGREVARTHQYLRPGGTLGGSGKPDPKKIFKEGKLYVVR